ncbi:MAG: sensor histidine kinase [Butyrivibrio sp.]
MNTIIDRIILLLIGVCCVIFGEIPEVYKIAVILTAIIYMGLTFYFAESRIHFLIDLAAVILLIMYDGFLPFVPLLVYEGVCGILRKDFREIYVISGGTVVYVLLKLAGEKRLSVYGNGNNIVLLLLWILGIILGIYFAYNTGEIIRLRREKLKIRDDNEEIRRLMVMKNRLLRERQDSEITMATLKERNRIAREIHDNVGHLLSRSLLQVGALRTIYKEEPMAASLADLQATLNESMTNVRNSVHNLHNESFDLQKAIKDLAAKNSGFSVKLEYDMENEVPRKIKYCLISVITESFENARKYSDGDRIEIILREHPGLYQLIFQDNGSKAIIKETGIGLHNIKSRVDELDGSTAFSTEEGFRIFISIPKKGAAE